jgi:hypothetical protein
MLNTSKSGCYLVLLSGLRKQAQFPAKSMIGTTCTHSGVHTDETRAAFTLNFTQNTQLTILNHRDKVKIMYITVVTISYNNSKSRTKKMRR